jgi:hypothetical protein
MAAAAWGDDGKTEVSRQGARPDKSRRRRARQEPGQGARRSSARGHKRP